MKMPRAPAPSLQRTPHYQAQSGSGTRHERAEHLNGTGLLATIVRGEKRPRYAPFKGSR
jgi:hypothetical protein